MLVTSRICLCQRSSHGSLVGQEALRCGRGGLGNQIGAISAPQLQHDVFGGTFPHHPGLLKASPPLEHREVVGFVHVAGMAQAVDAVVRDC